MTGKQIQAFIVTCCVLALLAACKQQAETPPAPPPVATGHTYSQKGSVHEMMIVPETTDFPEHEGKKEFVAYCGICHSLRYITQQPDFPRKTWEAEVHKMVEKYGAPIDTANSRKIADYLVTIKGAQQHS